MNTSNHPLSSCTPSLSIIEEIAQESNRFALLKQEVHKVIVGQYETINAIVIAILSNGHILLEGVPGIAKTTMIKAVAQALGVNFKRIQFTPDLLPTDLIGSPIFNHKIQDFETKKGPIFAHLILADEINRAPAKVQSALLEAMQERQVTIGSDTFKLDEPFLVFATQNPLEQEGTYRLPEAQVDRFMFKLLLEYPTAAQERDIICRAQNTPTITPVLSQQDIMRTQQLINTIYVDEKIVDYIVNLVYATRTPDAYNLKDIASYIQYGVSPRASLALYHAAKAHAFLQKRHFVIPDDIKAVAPAILRHRLILTYQAEAEGITSSMLIEKIVTTIATP